MEGFSITTNSSIDLRLTPALSLTEEQEYRKKITKIKIIFILLTISFTQNH